MEKKEEKNVVENEVENEKTVQEDTNVKTKLGKKNVVMLTIAIIVLVIDVFGFLVIVAMENSRTIVSDKPIIYLYPTTETDITVKLGNYENVTCIYPEYNDGWNVKASPNGTLIDLNTGRTLYSLYWEGINTVTPNMDYGFVVKGSDTATFLEDKLSILGLTDREAQEFIIYWLPKMQNNNYNFIRFQSMEEINSNMPLEFSVEPDTLIRVLMEFKPLNTYIDVPEQQLTTPQRTGFVVVEWGGTELK